MSPTDSKAKKGGSIVDVKTMEQFKTLTGVPQLSVIHFWASWANQVKSPLKVFLHNPTDCVKLHLKVLYDTIFTDGINPIFCKTHVFQLNLWNKLKCSPTHFCQNKHITFTVENSPKIWALLYLKNCQFTRTQGFVLCCKTFVYSAKVSILSPIWRKSLQTFVYSAKV
jgi:hypothetical protein